jgi:mono/diheme cytochrome c family protein
MDQLYALTLFAHSYLRWLVLALALWVSVQSFIGWRRATPWKQLHERFHALFSGVLRLQFVIGLGLYLFLSRLSRAFFTDPGVAIKVREFRFFGLEHALMMLVAVAVAESGRGRSKRVDDPKRRQRTVFLTTSVALLLMVLAVPWPFMPTHRPLLRSTSASRTPVIASEACPPSYRERCASCHGTNGRGNGVLAATLATRPRSFADPTWHRADERLRSIIRDGGAMHGMSPLMPAHADLSSQELDALVACLRSFH